jgi:hypothetical protein
VKRPEPTLPISSGKRARIDNKPLATTPVVKRLRRSTNNLVSANNDKTSNCDASKQKDSENTVPLSTNVVNPEQAKKPDDQPTKKRSRSPTPISVSTETETTPKSSVKSKTLNVVPDDDSKRRPANTVSMNEVIKLHQV